ncbi:PREDICTED: extended synaptotagmin-2 isoform X2 [Nicrophorus vespilloides]|uniref:Extended synaptotagmin-2 isoform X2 n=1 Tax=Nicrophorus vespilloides TaxID=110193 RepID=A0ABM1N816_NICVS|nr:PREDICTED: extended synaptotagmin-2 isoform X2 [Nicrophorus vespilloides]
MFGCATESMPIKNIVDMAGASKEEKSESSTESKEIQRSGDTMSELIVSTVKKVSLVGIVYLAGYMNWSVAWLIGPIVMLVVRDQWRKDNKIRRNMAQAVAMSNEKTVIQARLNDLPAWVFFPDIERTEWLNRIIKQCWPNVNSYAKHLIMSSIQPALRTSLEKYKLNGFKFERIILGEIPFRIGGVKVYDKNISRNEIIMDLDIYYAGNCDISFSVSGMKGGIRDFQLHGMLRVVMKPLISEIPLIGGLQVFFLNNPTIDFDLVGIVDIFDLPGFSDILRRIVVEQVASMMVLPNKFPIKLSDTIESEILKRPEPEGVLRVHVIEAKNLMKKDISVLGKGKSDPYAVLKVGAQEFQTKTIMNTVDPKWDYWCEFVISDASGQQLYLHLWDKDDAKDDEILGRATIEVANVAKKGQEDLWITLEQAKTGIVHLRLTWLKLSTSYEDLKAALAETQILRVTDMHTAILCLYIDSAKMLPQMRSSTKPDPYLTIRVGKYSQQTSVVMRTTDPVWQQGFTFLVANPESDSMYFKVLDQKTGGEMGELVYQLTTLSQKVKLEVPQQPFGLKKGGPESKLVMSMHMRILKSDLPEENEVPIQQDSGLHRQGSTSSSASSIIPPSPIRKPIISREPSVASTGGVSQLGVTERAEEVLVEEETPLLTSAPAPMTTGLIHRSPSITSSTGDQGLGRIQLTLRYSVNMQRLIVVIHKVANIPLKDPSNIPDPYVKLYLLPDRLKETKRKTAVIKDNCNPIFDEQFEYVISQGELTSQQLEITVCTQKQLFYSSSNVLGQIVVDLDDRLTQPINSWFDLQPEMH